MTKDEEQTIRNVICALRGEADDVAGAVAEAHRHDDRQLAFGAFMDEVRHHLAGLAVDLLFARGVEVKLQQIIAFGPDADAAAASLAATFQGASLMGW